MISLKNILTGYISSISYVDYKHSPRKKCLMNQTLCSGMLIGNRHRRRRASYGNYHTLLRLCRN